jgi:hypothetical protein
MPGRSSSASEALVSKFSFDRCLRCREAKIENRLLGDHGFDQLDHLLDDTVDLDARGLQTTASRVCEHLRREFGRSLAGQMNIIEVFPRRMSLRQFPDRQACVAEDHAQQVVEVMGYTAGEDC